MTGLWHARARFTVLLLRFAWIVCLRLARLVVITLLPSPRPRRSYDMALRPTTVLARTNLMYQAASIGAAFEARSSAANA